MNKEIPIRYLGVVFQRCLAGKGKMSVADQGEVHTDFTKAHTESEELKKKLEAKAEETSAPYPEYVACVLAEPNIPKSAAE